MAVCSELALIEYFLKIAQEARQEGLLVIERVIQDIEKQEDFDPFDLTYMGLRLVVEGYDCEDIQKIFDNYRKKILDEFNFNVITQSCLAIQRGDGCYKLILYYASLLPVKMRRSDSFLNLAEKYGYSLKYETWAEHESKAKKVLKENS
jgi:hypothetical protein